MKALSYIVASILMLIITVALSGTAYLYISGVFTATVQGIEIADAYCSLGEVILSIRNIGSSSIASLDIEQTNPKDDFITPSFQGTIEPGKTIQYKDTCEGEQPRKCIYRISPPAGKAITSEATCTSRPESLVLSLHFDEGSGTAAKDSSGNGNDGTLVNGPTWVAGKFGNAALQFDGINDFVNVSESASLNLSQTITVEAWLKLSKLMYQANPIFRSGSPLKGDVNEDGIVDQTDRDIVNTYYGSFLSELGIDYPPYPRFDVNENGIVDMGDLSVISTQLLKRKATWFLQIQDESGGKRLVFSLGNSAQTLQVAMVSSSKIFTSADEGQWFHVAGTYDNSTISLYINGVLDNSTSASGRFVTNETLRIGAENPNQRTYLNYFNGTIDEVRIYNGAII